MPPMKVLGIESSCDETGVALYDTGRGLLATRFTRRWTCTRPTAAWCPNWPRATTSGASIPLLRGCWPRRNAPASEDIDAIAYTAGPGLAGALLVGASFAEALAMALGCRRLPVHHLEGHLLSPLLAADRAALPFRRPAGVGRPYAADARGRRRRLRTAGGVARRCGRRGLRQDRQAARPRLSPAGRNWRKLAETGRRGASSCRGPCCTAATCPSAFPA
jgi:hypothetical protein